MRFESVQSLLFGAVLFAVAYIGLVRLLRPRARNVLVRSAFAILLGVAIIPARGELVLVPVSKLLLQGGPQALFGLFFFAVWFGIALFFIPLPVAKQAQQVANKKPSNPSSSG